MGIGTFVVKGAYVIFYLFTYSQKKGREAMAKSKAAQSDFYCNADLWNQWALLKILS